jgi:hypothetical protein
MMILSIGNTSGITVNFAVTPLKKNMRRSVLLTKSRGNDVKKQLLKI